MPVLCDVSVLAALCYQHHSHYRIAHEWLDQHDTERSLTVCRASQLGLLRLLGTRSVMQDDVLTAYASWQVYDQLMDDDRFVFLHEPAGIDKSLRQLTLRRTPITSLWLDAYLAAFAMTAGLQFVTFDKGFRQFPDLDLTLLGDAIQ